MTDQENNYRPHHANTQACELCGFNTGAVAGVMKETEKQLAEALAQNARLRNVPDQVLAGIERERSYREFLDEQGAPWRTCPFAELKGCVNAIKRAALAEPAPSEAIEAWMLTMGNEEGFVTDSEEFVDDSLGELVGSIKVRGYFVPLPGKE